MSNALSERSESKGCRELLSMFFVYVARCADGTLYVGKTQDLDAREDTHNSGRGGSYTAARRPVEIVYSEFYESIARATERERHEGVDDSEKGSSHRR